MPHPDGTPSSLAPHIVTTIAETHAAVIVDQLAERDARLTAMAVRILGRRRGLDLRCTVSIPAGQDNRSPERQALLICLEAAQ